MIGRERIEQFRRIKKGEKQKLLIGLLILLILLIGMAYFVYSTIFEFYFQRGIADDNFVTNIKCNTNTKCPVGMWCLKFNEKMDAVCASPDVQLYYNCPKNQTAKLTGTFPRQVICE